MFFCFSMVVSLLLENSQHIAVYQHIMDLDQELRIHELIYVSSYVLTIPVSFACSH